MLISELIDRLTGSKAYAGDLKVVVDDRGELVYLHPLDIEIVYEGDTPVLKIFTI